MFRTFRACALCDRGYRDLFGAYYFSFPTSRGPVRGPLVFWSFGLLVSLSGAPVLRSLVLPSDSDGDPFNGVIRTYRELSGAIRTKTFFLDTLVRTSLVRSGRDRLNH